MRGGRDGVARTGVNRRLVASQTPIDEILEEVAHAIEAGGTVIFPTDTVYGIGADPAREDAVLRIFEAKQRPRDKALALHFGAVSEALEYVSDPASAAVVRRLLPGPVTVIVSRPSFVADFVTAGLPTVGLRVPDHPLCSAILERCGPLAGTSANRSGLPAYAGEGGGGALPEADVFVDAGPTPHRGESTIVDVSGGRPKLVREGVVSVRDIEAKIGRTLLAVVLVLAMMVPALAQNRPPSRPAARPSPALPGSSLTNGQFTVDTDETNYDLNSGDFDMPHHVHFTRPGTDVTGDRAHGNTRTNQITITGHVVLHQTGTVNSLGSGAQRVTGEEPSTLTTDELHVDGRTRTYTAVGNVKWTQGNKLLTADRGILNENTHQLNLQGNVHIQQEEQSMNAERVDYNLETEDGVAYGSPVLARMPVEPAPPGMAPPTPPPRRGLRRFF